MGQLATLGVGGANAAVDTIIMPYYEHHPTWSSIDASSGVTYTRYQSNLRLGGGLGGHSSLADADDGDYISFYVCLAAGTYTLTVLYDKDNLRGIMEASLDGSVIGTYDAYTAGTTFNAVASFTSVAVATDGVYTFKLALNGKNASSTDYAWAADWFSFTRTGA